MVLQKMLMEMASRDIYFGAKKTLWDPCMIFKRLMKRACLGESHACVCVEGLAAMMGFNATLALLCCLLTSVNSRCCGLWWVSRDPSCSFWWTGAKPDGSHFPAPFPELGPASLPCLMSPVGRTKHLFLRATAEVGQAYGLCFLFSWLSL